VIWAFTAIREFTPFPKCATSISWQEGTMSKALDNAIKRAAELRKELAEVEGFIRLYEVFSGGSDAAEFGASPSRETQADRQFIGNNPVDNQETVSGEKSGRIRTRHRRGATPNELAEVVERVIRGAGRPMTRGELVSALDARDMEIPAEDKPRYIGTIMWRNKSKFVNISGLGYWVRGEAWRQDGTRVPIPPSEIEDPEQTGTDVFD